MPAQKLDKQHSLKILNMEPTGVSTNSHQQLMSDCDSSDAVCSGNPQDARNNSMRAISRMKWITVIILCYVNLINYMDRFTLAGVLKEIQDEFHINDDLAGLLQTVFVLSYMLFAPLFGYMGDRYNRRYIMAFGVFLWSLTTLLGSYMPSFTGFIIFRGLVGIGEASYSTIAPTIISDMFVKDIRSRMLALFYFAIPVGSGLGYIVGSETAKLAGQWQWGLRVTPIMGAVAVLLILFLMLDPARGEHEADGQQFVPTSYTTDIKELSRNASFMLSTAGFTCVAFVAGALAWWGPKFITLGIKTQPGHSGVEEDDVALKFGVIAMCAGLIGVPFGSFLAQKMRPRFTCQADPIICAIGLLTSAPLVYFALLASQSHTWLCYLFVFLAELALNLNWSIVADMLTFVFGVITMLAGIVGLSLGLFLSQSLKRRFPRADPLICAGGLFISAPLLTGCTFVVQRNTVWAYVLLFFGQVALNLNWAIVADILLYVVIPTRRSTAEAFQILVSHALGDAGSPYLIGVISVALKNQFSAARDLADGSMAMLADAASSSSSLNQTVAAVIQTMESDEDNFKSLQYALFTTCFVEVIGGFFFLITALYVLRDKMLVDQAITAGDNGQPKNIYADDPLTEVDQRRNLVS